MDVAALELGSEGTRTETSGNEEMDDEVKKLLGVIMPSRSQDCTLSTYLCVFLSISHCEPSVLGSSLVLSPFVGPNFPHSTLSHLLMMESTRTFKCALKSILQLRKTNKFCLQRGIIKAVEVSEETLDLCTKHEKDGQPQKQRWGYVSERMGGTATGLVY